MKFIRILLFCFLIMSFSCGKTDIEILQEQKNDSIKLVEENRLKTEQRIKDLNESNSKEIYNITQKYNATSGIDTLYAFTSYFQQFFIEKKNLLSLSGDIVDIVKKDTSYIFKINSNNEYHSKFNSIISFVVVNSQKFNEFELLYDSKKKSSSGCFIIKVSKIISIIPKIVADAELEGDYDSNREDLTINPFLYLDFDERMLIYKGEMIDFWLNDDLLENKE